MTQPPHPGSSPQYGQQPPRGPYPPHGQPGFGPPQLAQPKPKRTGLWALGCVLALFGSCGACAIGGALLPDTAPAADASADPGDKRSGANPRPSKQPTLRSDVPKPAAKVILAARQAIHAKDYAALQRTLTADTGMFRTKSDDEDEDVTGAAAIKAWRKEPAMFQRIDTTLSKRCKVDKDEELVAVTCGGRDPGDMFVMLTNTEGPDRKFIISGVAVVAE